MAKVSQPELKRFLDKRISVNIQGGRKINGTLRGFDIFLNLVVDEAVEQVHPATSGGQTNGNAWQDGKGCGMVVSISSRQISVGGCEGEALRLTLCSSFLDCSVHRSFEAIVSPH